MLLLLSLRLVVMLLLLLVRLLLLMLISTGVALLVIWMLLVSSPVVGIMLFCGAAVEFDVHPTFVGFRPILKAQLLTDLFDAGLDLLDVAWGVVAFADNYVEMGLSVSCDQGQPLSQ